MIIDDRIKNLYAKKGVDYMSLVFRQEFLNKEEFEEDMKEAVARGSESLFMADSLEELAEKAGVCKEKMLQTVEEYNELCEGGCDSLFYKDSRFMRPITKAPFYAAKMRPGGYGTLGGIKVDHTMQVVSQDWHKIPGLYAAGTDTCTIYGDSYMFLLPGNTMGYALNSGRIAGESAAEYIETME